VHTHGAQSDPGVFTELLNDIGVEDTEVSEIYSLDENEQQTDGASYGLIFLFKWRQETDEREVIDPLHIPSLFFARQVVTNACATQAILSVILNVGNCVPDAVSSIT
jgi:ubiquitin carboxyl-terminal hydrolase L5